MTKSPTWRRCATPGGAIAVTGAPAASPRERARSPLRGLHHLGCGLISRQARCGSRLVDTESGAVVWGGDDGLPIDVADPDALRLAALPLVSEGMRLADVRDAVRPRGVVRRARPSIFGVNVDLEIYAGLIGSLISGGYDFRETRAEEIAERDVNLDAFEFPYDWRRDVVEVAQDLDAFLRRKRDQVAEARRRVLGDPGPPVRFDLIGRSMGSIVTRH